MVYALSHPYQFVCVSGVGLWIRWLEVDSSMALKVQ